ncbi:MAG TPA: hypothetical protein V6C65_22080 [Allocoleopsis sp.]
MSNIALALALCLKTGEQEAKFRDRPYTSPSAHDAKNTALFRW